ncbi:FAD-binding oxidoreductase [Phaeobacter inhibens]|uniref:FAD-binding oxidoreductase n=1 Tax=Phaeobacter inhibens TaxID=221822 RepID=UPI000C9CD1D0|nr:FAD-binding oxidoreductase [Phaeobacter inhibens]AUQ54649.1 putative FAD dependent oxidoreductase [Phaeobacter inhibens]AUQ78665.1 putative FAD dependent oxidoreductase [Phaeobacter inhibens]AUR15824.1 putative FAD dependent oxidoreductase [Phaeobacter inhibens]
MDISQISALFAPVIGTQNVITGERLALRNTGYCAASYDGGVLLTPGSAQDVSKICWLAAEHGLAIIPQGGLTGLAQGTATAPGQVALSLEKMTRILELDPVQGIITAEAGVTLQQVIDAAEPLGLAPGVNLPSRGSCTLGGLASTNAGGIQAIRYGMARDNILGLEAVLADGTILDLNNTLLKNKAGYDLKQLFIGSEGTLGIITKLTLRLHSRPSSVQTALIGCAGTEDLFQVLASARKAFGGSLLSFEAMWPEFFIQIATHLGSSLVSPDCGIYGVIETGHWGDTEHEDALTTFLAGCFEDGLLQDGTVAQSETQRRTIWQLREDADVIESPNGPCLSYDVGLRLHDIPGYVEQLQMRIAKDCKGVTCYVFGHMGDGNLHIMVGPAHDPASHATIDGAVYGVLQQFTGTTVSAEHGIGLEKRMHLPLSRPTPALAAMRQLKTAFDPQSTLNPSKVFDDLPCLALSKEDV